MVAQRSLGQWSRRQFTSCLGLGGLALLLAACGQTAPTNTPTAAPAVAGTATTVSGATSPAAVASPPAVPTAPREATLRLESTPVAKRTAVARGEIRYATSINFPAGIDGIKNGYATVTFGVGETLTRLTPENRLEPWLAESLVNVNPTTWRVKLRPNVQFWDNSAVDAEAVAAAMRTNWEQQASATSLIDKETKLTVVDPLTLDFVLPAPSGNFPNALSSQFFVVHKENGKTMSGPFRPTKFDVDRELVVEAFPGHWGGPPALAKFTIRNVPDANTRALALQSGEVDLVGGVLPETVATFGPTIATSSIPSSRIHTMMLNSTRGIFAEQQVREATAYAVNREALLQVALSGQGAALSTFFPTLSGFDQVQMPTFDPQRARQLLDTAGWVAGADGVRAKAGKRLAFTLLSYPGRPELTQMALAMQAQLKELGYEMQVREVPSIDPELKKAEYDATMYSMNSLNTGDPAYLYSLLLAKDGAYNYPKVELPGVEALLVKLRNTIAPAERQAVSRQIQEIVRQQVPQLYLVAAPLIVAYAKERVRDFSLHPIDLYLVNPTMHT